jgi:hypothetical protein
MTQPPYADLERHVPEERELGYRLDALLDELVAAGWPGEFDARERAALNRLGWYQAGWRRRLARWLGRGTR